MAKDRTTTSYAILGLLTVRDWTTYELAKQVQRSLNWFWPRAERKLYDEPKRLVEEGLATADREHVGQRARTVYRVTDAGREALRSWLDDAPAPRLHEFEGMVKVFFADAGTTEQLITTLGRIEDEAAQRVETIRGFASGDTPFPRRLHLRALALPLQFELEDAVRRWAHWAALQVAQWPAADDAGSWDVAGVLDGLARGESPIIAR
ncbi:PadR family transcriptional regulator [uncultured Jatrophihabitans sp.]|uniref:PadR family transcriptional regulator n=1 Tax=uncultured Jatrophihabitans sp. TaxID=1610747 RepID=UPI0035CB4344